MAGFRSTGAPSTWVPPTPPGAGSSLCRLSRCQWQQCRRLLPGPGHWSQTADHSGLGASEAQSACLLLFSEHSCRSMWEKPTWSLTTTSCPIRLGESVHRPPPSCLPFTCVLIYFPSLPWETLSSSKWCLSYLTLGISCHF